MNLSPAELWIGGILTLMIFSFLYRDNPFYKFAEHLFVGVSAAYWMVQGVWGTLMPNLVAKVAPGMVQSFMPEAAGKNPEWHYLIAALFGVLLLTRLVPSIGWLSRWSLAFVVGYSAGTNFIRYLQSDFIAQIRSTMIPLVVQGQGGLDLGASFSHLVLIVGVFCGLVYFFFSKEHHGALGRVSRIGVWTLMVTFGASFGYTVMARISLLLGRLQALIIWLRLVSGGS
ncbi:hypothetical protein JXA88_13200 [Candidatus Fermentibacteria bacterium]|nr:hypothetical protein [Candidatus Fermentibacteria bacterium]